MSTLARVVLATPPATLNVTVISNTRVDVSWQPVIGASLYDVYRNGALVEQTSLTSHSSTGLAAGTLYSFQVSSFGNDLQEGPKSSQFTGTTLPAPDTTPPSVPTITVANLSATSQRVSLSVASTDIGGSGLASYTLDRATNSTFTANLNSSTVATTGFPVTVLGLSPSTQYFYRARGVDGANNQSVNSATVNATTTTSTLDSDFQLRALSATKYAVNFTDVYVAGVLQPSRVIANTQDLLDEAFEVPGDTTAVTRETSIKLSGSGSLRIALFDSSGPQSGSWAFHPNGTDGTLYRRLYVQFAVYYPAATLGYRWKTSGSNSFSTSALKVINFGQFGAGQIVVCNPRFLGFPSAFCDGAQMISDSSEANNLIASNPWGVTVHHIQDAVDTGVAASTKSDFLTRYGPLMRGLDGDMDLSYNPSVLLQNRSQPSGFPDTRAATNGVPFKLDGWLVIEAFLEYNQADPSTSSFQMWAAPYGQAPTLIMNNVSRLPLGTNTTNSWDRFELLNYDTERVSETGVRPTLYTYYSEVLVSDNPINFPGGFTLPSSQGGLSTLAQAVASLSAGQSALFNGTNGLSSSNTISGNVLTWQARAHYDEVRKQIYFVGKSAQSQGGFGRFMIYDEAADSWTADLPSFLDGAVLGHVYDAHTYDWATGDVYFPQYGTKLVRKWTQGSALTSWNLDAASNFTFASTFNGGTGEHAAAWHPNLYGTGDGGLVIMGQVNAGTATIFAWRKSTNTWASLGTTPASGTIDRATALYCRGLNAVILTTGSQLSAFRVDAGPTLTRIDDTPVLFGFPNVGSVGGVVVDSPFEDATVYALEKHTTGRRVWKLTGSTSWTLQSGVAHTFVSNDSAAINWVAAPLYGLQSAGGRRGIMSIERTGTTVRTRIWIPPT